MFSSLPFSFPIKFFIVCGKWDRFPFLLGLIIRILSLVPEQQTRLLDELGLGT